MQIASWTLSSLSKAWETLISQDSFPMKLCLFIDGLDEDEGLDADIAKLFSTAAASPNVKICASSRPHVVS
jgi:hypothetical protein